MQIEQIDIKTIIPYEFNNRKHNETQVNRIANSIKEFGYNQPIVVDEDNIILVGHGRLHASLKLGLKQVPVLKKLGLTEAQKKAYRILDNKLQNDSEWDFDNLNLELDFLEDDGFDLPAWGLDELRIGGENDELKDISQGLEISFILEIKCMSEGHQEELYNKFKKEGLECRILTL